MLKGGERQDTRAWGWLVRAVLPAQAPIPWPAALRAAIAISAMSAVGLAAANPVAGMLAAIGALTAVIQNTAGPYRMRLLNVSVPMAAGAGGLLIALACQGHGWWTVAALVLVALVSGLISPIGAISSGAGLSLLLLSVLGTGMELTGPWWQPPLYFLGGAAFFLGLLLLGWPVRATDPERQAVAAVYIAIADLLTAAPDARRLIGPAVDNAQDVLLRHRMAEQGRDSEVLWLITMLNASTPLMEFAVLMAHTGETVPAGHADAVRRLGTAVAEGHRSCAIPELEAGPAFTAAFGYARRRLAGPRPGDPDLMGRPPTWPTRVIEALHTVVFTPTTWRYGLRLALCIGLAEVLTSVVSLPRSYWVPVTVLFILKPDLGSVFVRALLRGLGTIVGVAVGVLLLLLIPRGWPTVPVIFLCGGMVPVLAARSYAMQTAAVTPMVLLLIDMVHQEDISTLATTRLADTLLGCLIVLVFGYALWPESWRVRVGEQLADTVDSAATYLHQCFFAPFDIRSRRRRDIHRRITGLRTALQQAFAEPPPASTRAAAWWPAVVSVEQLVDAVTAASIRVEHGEETPSPEDVEASTAALRALAADIREASERRPPEHHEDHAEVVIEGALSEVATEIRSLRAALPLSRRAENR
jgi:uncharacterized membrane protein YccC